jgi:predicted amidohydrolase
MYYRKNKFHLHQLRGVLLIVLLGISSFTIFENESKSMNGSGKEKQKLLRVAGVKLNVSNDIAVNVNAIKKAIDFAHLEKADILLTPEGSLSGYTPDFNKVEVQNELDKIVAYASSSNVGLALGTCFYEEDGKCYNQIRFYDKAGRLLGFHSKILRCGDHGDPKRGEINHYAVTPLRTFEFEGVIIGGLICNDMWANPECTTLPDTHLSQQLSKMGARIIFHAVFGGRDDSEWSQVNWNYHESNLRMRARSGGIWIVTADSSNPTNLDSSCPSGVIDPKGNWVCTTESAGIQYFTFTIDLQ